MRRNRAAIRPGLAALAFILLPCATPAKEQAKIGFQPSGRCFPCHNGLATPKGEDVSIGFDWRASIMANSSRDPYWQASVRRETIDHPEVTPQIEDECSTCHMPVTRYEAKLQGRLGQIFAHLPFDSADGSNLAADGVTCSICHQIGKEKLGTRESFNGGFVIDPPQPGGARPEYGPFDVDQGHKRIMQTSTGGFLPFEEAHIRESEVCATCHTLFTAAHGEGGKVVGELPEQMPYPEWLHSSYRGKQSCQNCHMPEVQEEMPITSVLGTPRQGLHRHTFVGANFFMQRMLNNYRYDLSVWALPQELTAAAEQNIAFLQSQSARLRVDRLGVAGGRLNADIFVENIAGHKLPTAYPSRRAWLHFVVRDRNRQVIFESGALRADGSIAGNDNDTDPARFEPHYTEIRSADQVQIYEPILKDPAGHVTTGLLTAVGYLKDNRLLPHGFDKRTAPPEIAIMGAAREDPDFTDDGDRIRYSVAVDAAQGPFEVEAELWYQPIGYRWANNLKAYNSAAEPRRFNGYYDVMGPATAVILTHASMLTDGVRLPDRAYRTAQPTRR